MHLLRSVMVWLLIIAAEIIHGTLRQLFVVPLTGDFRARQIAVFSGMALIFVITYVSIRWINAPGSRSLLGIGSIWVVLTVVFEFGLGAYVLNFSAERIFEDYDLTRGGLMGFGLLFMFFAPYLADKLRSRKNK